MLATGPRPLRPRAMRWSACSGTPSPGPFPGPATEFFYSNAMHLRTGHDGTDEGLRPALGCLRYECACCPPNLARLMASIQSLPGDQGQLRPPGATCPSPARSSTIGPSGRSSSSSAADHPGRVPPTSRSRVPVGQPWALWVRLPDWAGREGAQVGHEPGLASLSASEGCLYKGWRGNGPRGDRPGRCPCRCLPGQ